MSSFCSYAQPPAQTLSPEAWEGVWNAEQTLITLRVVRSGDQFAVEPLETMGLLWVSRNGMINGNTATIEVEYQGVIGQVLVELIDENTATARATSCQPEFHVVCALVKDQQARFIKVEPAAGQ